MQETHIKVEMAMSALTDGRPPNKVVAHWAQKLSNMKLRRYAFLDPDGTSRAAPEEDKEDLEETKEMFRKTSMFPDRHTREA